MPTLTKDQIASYAYAAGFRGEALRMATAIALAESGGNPTAYNPEIGAGTKPGSGSRGLWQIYGQAHPEYNSAIAFDPLANAKAAFAVFQQAGGKFTPWSTYNNKAALNYYNQLGALTIKTPTGQVSQVVSAPLSSAKGTASAAPVQNQSALSQAVSSGITQAVKGATSGINFQKLAVDWGFIIGGGLLLVIGLIMLFYGAARDFSKTPLGEAAIKAGSMAIAA